MSSFLSLIFRRLLLYLTGVIVSENLNIQYLFGKQMSSFISLKNVVVFACIWPGLTYPKTWVYNYYF